MNTEKLYQTDRYIKTTEAEIIEASSGNSPEEIILVLDRTIFFPGGGGQSCDLGQIAGIPVTEVFEKDSVIYHRLNLGPNKSSDASTLTPGTTVKIDLDWNRRFDNMQRHSGEHILSGVFFDLFGGVNRGFHMGDDYMTIDISLEEDAKTNEITQEMLEEAELSANEIIWRDLPVTARYFETREEASKVPTRKPVTVEKDITIVTIGDENHPADSVACCGTHPSTSGQVGLIKLFKVEPNKGMYRVYFDAGKRALLHCRNSEKALGYIEKDLSAGTEDVIEKYETRKTKNSESRDRLYKLTERIIENEQRKILRGMNIDEDLGGEIDSNILDSTTYVNTNKNQVYEYEILTADDVINIGRGLSGSIRDILFLLHSPGMTLFLFSDRLDCGKLVKENAAVFGGKGGGNKNFARAIFTRREDCDMFIDAITKLTQ